MKFSREFGTDIGSAVEQFGEEVVLSLFQAQATIRCQAAVRAAMEARDEAGRYVNDDATAIKFGLDYVPGVVGRRAGTDAWRMTRASKK